MSVAPTYSIVILSESDGRAVSRMSMTMYRPTERPEGND